MTEPRLHHLSCLNPQGLHRMAYWEWGDSANPNVLVCVHGLARQGRDFDTLARVLSDAYRVICPDVVGRGQSAWLSDAKGYAVPQYVADMVSLVARLNVLQVDWLGTSMGGLIGMLMAALPGTPVRRLVLNDIGPNIEAPALQRIGSYLGLPVRWPTLEAAADGLLAISKGFGPHTRAQWLALTRPQLVAADEGGGDPAGGGFKSHYDPKIAVPLRAVTPEQATAGQALLWQTYERITCRTLLLRGAESDLLSADTAQAMTQRGPRAVLHTFAGVGHAPTLVQPDQVAAVRQFLLSE